MPQSMRRRQAALRRGGGCGADDGVAVRVVHKQPNCTYLEVPIGTFICWLSIYVGIYVCDYKHT